MTENQLLSSCLKLLRSQLPGAVIIKHADPMTSGVPDVSITWLGKTSWWEFKAGAKIKWANELQQLTCRRLAAAGSCRVVFYEESPYYDRVQVGKKTTAAGTYKRTCICTPDEEVIAFATGFDHRFVMDVVRGVHD